MLTPLIKPCSRELSDIPDESAASFAMRMLRSLPCDARLAM